MNNVPFSKKQLLIGGSLLVVILLIALALTSNGSLRETAVQPSPPLATTSAPSSGNVYANPETGVRFARLSQLTVKENSSDVITVSSADTASNPDAPLTGTQISIFKGNRVNDQLAVAKDLFQTPYITDIMVDGKAAKELSGYGKGALAGKFIKFVEIYSGGKTYEITYFEGEPDFTKEDFEEILRSFTLPK